MPSTRTLVFPSLAAALLTTVLSGGDAAAQPGRFMPPTPPVFSSPNQPGGSAYNANMQAIQSVRYAALQGQVKMMSESHTRDSMTRWSGFKGGGGGGFMPFAGPMQARAMWHNMMLQQRELERQQWEAARKERLAELRKLRQEEVARRNENYVRLAEKAENSGPRGTPEERAARYLHAADHFQGIGSVKAAAGFYQLVIRVQPNSREAALARAGLNRLAAN